MGKPHPDGRPEPGAAGARHAQARVQTRTRTGWRRGAALGLGLSTLVGLASVWLHVGPLVVVGPAAAASRFAWPPFGQSPQAAAQARAAQATATAADWERRWITPIDPNICRTEPTRSSRFVAPDAEQGYRVAGGEVALWLDPARARLSGRWTLREVVAPWGWLHATLPTGMSLERVDVAGRLVTPDRAHDHLAVPLDACARQACTVTLAFSVSLAPALTPDTALRAEALLPRLGLDEARLLRAPEARAAQGLPAFLTLPDESAGVPLAGVAPAGEWRWTLAVVDALPLPSAPSSNAGQLTQHTADPTTPPITGNTTGALDFLWLPLATPVAVEAPTPYATTNDAQALVADITAQQACVARRLGGAATVHHVHQDARPAPPSAGLQAAHLAAGQLLLPADDDPVWRSARIAYAIAQRHVADTARLRLGRGTQWVAHGLPGAVAWLCAAEHHPPEALRVALAQASSSATAALPADAAQVGAIAYAAHDGWVRHYAPLAALERVRRLTPEQLHTLLTDLGQGVRLPYAMASALGARQTTLALSQPLAVGPPPAGITTNAADATQRTQWRWQQGQWRAVGQSGTTWALPTPPWIDPAQALRLEAWPGLPWHLDRSTHGAEPTTAPSRPPLPTPSPLEPA